jgi:hypothetical protein
MKEKKVVIVDSWRNESLKEVNRLIQEGWEVEEVELHETKSCSDSGLTGSFTSNKYTLIKEI